MVWALEVLLGRHVPEHPPCVLAGGGEEVWDEAKVSLRPGLLGAPQLRFFVAEASFLPADLLRERPLEEPRLPRLPRLVASPGPAALPRCCFAEPVAAALPRLR